MLIPNTLCVRRHSLCTFTQKTHYLKHGFIISLISLLSACKIPPERPVQDGSTFINTQDSISTSATVTDKEESRMEQNLWQRIRDGYQLPTLNELSQHEEDQTAKIVNQRTAELVRRYQAHPDSLLRQMENASWYLHYITNELAQRNMPLELALLPFVESSFDPFAYSSGRASGLWQFIPMTADRFKLKRNWWMDERRDVRASTQAAISYLSYLYSHLGNDWLLALAAYNAGEGTVGRAIRANKKKGLPTDYWSLKLPRETRFYIPKLLVWADVIKHPNNYNVSLPTLRNTPRFASVNVGSQIDLAKMAQLTGVDIDTIYQLNPAYNRWSTDPYPPHALLVPAAQAQRVKQALADYPIAERVSWKRHKVSANESLSLIAEKYNTTVRSIQQTNQLRGTTIRVGQGLLIPSPSKSATYYRQSQTQRLAQQQQKSGAKHKAKNDRKVTHRVSAGESLWGIAKRYGVTPARIAHWNNMATRDILSLNQELVIWTRSTATTITTSHQVTSENAQSTQEKLRDATLRKVTYNVRSGDNLSVIADKFSIGVNDIRRWNNLGKGYLQPSQSLVLYIDVTQ